MALTLPVFVRALLVSFILWLTRSSCAEDLALSLPGCRDIADVTRIYANAAMPQSVPVDVSIDADSLQLVTSHSPQYDYCGTIVFGAHKMSGNSDLDRAGYCVSNFPKICVDPQADDARRVSIGDPRMDPSKWFDLKQYQAGSQSARSVDGTNYNYFLNCQVWCPRPVARLRLLPDEDLARYLSDVDKRFLDAMRKTDATRKKLLDIESRIEILERTVGDGLNGESRGHQ